MYRSYVKRYQIRKECETKALFPWNQRFNRTDVFCLDWKITSKQVCALITILFVAKLFVRERDRGT